MLKQIGGWLKNMARYSHIRINNRYNRLSIVFNECGGPVNFAFFIFNDHSMSLARVKNPTRWLFYAYIFGRKVVLPAREPIPLSE